MLYRISKLSLHLCTVYANLETQFYIFWKTLNFVSFLAHNTIFFFKPNLCSSYCMHFDKSCAKMSQNHTFNVDKVFLKLPPSSDFGLEARILQIGWFYRPKWKKVEKSASKNKHPIKLRFLIWRLQSANPEKKVIPENQGFGSCPFVFFFD